MKRLFILLCFFTGALHAQNYSFLAKDETSYFSDRDEVYILKIDSIKKEDRTHYYPLRQPIIYPKRNFQSCPDPSFAWVADSSHRISVDSIGNTHVHGFLIKTQAKVGEEWISRTDSTVQILSFISSCELETFMGITDSVKTFQFKLAIASDNPKAHLYDDLYYKISKSYGLVSTKLIEIGQQNGVLMSQMGMLGSSISLIGLEKAMLGFQVMTNKEIFDYQIGDRFDIKREEVRGGGSDIPKSDVYYISEVVIKKQMDTDYVEYTFARKIKHEASPFPGEIITSESSDTITEVHLFDFPIGKQINKLMGISYDFSELDMIQYYNLSNGGDSTIYRYIGGRGGCIWGGLTYPVLAKYKKGLVATYYQQYAQSPSSHKSQELIYYKKGTKEWGIPLVLGIDPNHPIGEFTSVISPNPSKGIINVITNRADAATFQLFGLTGNTLLEQPVTGQTVDVSHVPNGMYTYRVSMEDGKYKTGKLLVDK